MAEPVERVLKRLSSFELKRGEPAGHSLAKTSGRDDATELDGGTLLSPFKPAQVLQVEEKPELPEPGWERCVKRRTSVNNSEPAGSSNPVGPVRPACDNERLRNSPLSGLSDVELKAKMDLLDDSEKQLLAELRVLRREFNDKMMALVDVGPALAVAPHGPVRTSALPASCPTVACAGQPQSCRPSATGAATAAAIQQALHRPPLISGLGRQLQQQFGPVSNGMPSFSGPLREGAWPALQSAAAAASAAAVVGTNGAWMMPPPSHGRAVPRLPVHVGALLPPQLQPQHQPPQPRRLPSQQHQQQLLLHEQHRQLLQLQQAIQLQRASAVAEAMIAAGQSARASADSGVTGGVVVRRRSSGLRPC